MDIIISKLELQIIRVIGKTTIFHILLLKTKKTTKIIKIKTVKE